PLCYAAFQPFLTGTSFAFLPGVPPRVDPGALDFAAYVQRRTARLAVDGQVQIAIPGLELPLELRDLSLGGFAIVAPRPYWKGMTHWFTFSTFRGGAERSVTLV